MNTAKGSLRNCSDNKLEPLKYSTWRIGQPGQRPAMHDHLKQDESCLSEVVEAGDDMNDSHNKFKEDIMEIK